MTLPAADRLAIQRLLALGLRGLDAGDGEAVAACFSADGWFDAAPHGRFEGHEAIAAFVRAHEAANEHGSRHWTNNVILEGDETEGVRLSCYLLGFDLGAAEAWAAPRSPGSRWSTRNCAARTASGASRASGARCWASRLLKNP